MSTNIGAVERAAAASWKVLMAKSVTNAISGLSQMCNAHISITSIDSKEVPVVQIPELLGGPEAMIAGVYLEMSGAGTGHIVIVYMPETAFELIDMLLGKPRWTTSEFGEMEKSVLGEVGNVMGSQFLSTVADATGFELRVSPPAVMNDMSAAVMDATMAELLSKSDSVLMVNTTFGTQDRQINGTFLAMPDAELEHRLLAQLSTG
jgi:chemotaxis protein CheC